MNKVDRSKMTPPVYSDDGDGDNENDSISENEENDEENDADNDENDNEDDDKNGHKSLQSSGDEESSEEEGSGSEDSSDMDVEECEKKREEFIEDISELEGQFAVLREQLYRERLSQIETKLEEVANGRALEYLQPLEELQEAMRVQLEVGTVLRQLRQKNINNKYEADKVEQGALDHLPELVRVKRQVNDWFEENSKKVIEHGRIRDALDSEKTRIYHHELLFKTVERDKIIKLQLEDKVLEGHGKCADHLNKEVRILLGNPAKLNGKAQEELLTGIKVCFTEEDNIMLDSAISNAEIRQSLTKANQKASHTTH